VADAQAALAEHDALAAENRAMKAQGRAEHGDEPFPLTPEERRELKEKRDQLSPERRQQLDPDDFIGVDDGPQHSRHG
jgi:hypothetical protein